MLGYAQAKIIELWQENTFEMFFYCEDIVGANMDYLVNFWDTGAYGNYIYIFFSVIYESSRHLHINISEN
jgi:hypothetical protein